MAISQAMVDQIFQNLVEIGEVTLTMASLSKRKLGDMIIAGDGSVAVRPKCSSILIVTYMLERRSVGFGLDSFEI